MSTADDLRILYDAIDSIVHGALPSWGNPSTKLGTQTVRSLSELYRKYVDARMLTGRAEYDVSVAKQAEDQQRAHAENLTARCELLEEQITLLRDERRQLRKRLEECLPWVGACPLDPTKIREMHLIKDLAQDTLHEVRKDSDLARRALENVQMLAGRLRKTDPVNAEHLTRFCLEAGVKPSPLRINDAEEEH